MSRRSTTLAFCVLALAGCDATVLEPVLDGAGAAKAPPTDFDVDLEDEYDLDLDVDPCEMHCRTYASRCADAFAYESYDQCESLCAYWEGAPGGVDRAQCRIDGLAGVEAANTEEERQAACADIGPDSETCGTAFVATCERYCDNYVPACVLHDGYFLSRAGCMDWCDPMPLGDEGSTKDTIACRVVWADEARAQPAWYCDEAGPESHACR